jgi:hypothetical protein
MMAYKSFKLFLSFSRHGLLGEDLQDKKVVDEQAS